MTNQEIGMVFEHKCYKKLKELGFSELRLTQNTDNGADIIGSYNGTKYAFQCKKHEKKQGNKCVQQVIASVPLYKCHRAVVISHSKFTSAAISLAKASNCILIVASEFFVLKDFPPNNYTDIFAVAKTYDMDYNIVEQYEIAKKRLGRTPKWSELNKTLKYKIREKYGNYSNFSRELGTPMYTTKPSNEDLKKEYSRIKTAIGKIPTLDDIRKNTTYSLNPFRTYPFTKLQKECGDRPNIERGVSPDTLKDAYFDLEKRIGHPPTIKELDESGLYKASYYRNRWGNFNSFLKEIGKTRTQAGLPRVYNKEELIVIYALLKMLMSYINEDPGFRINHTVLERLRLDNKCLISPGTISNRFNTWNDFVKYLNDEGIEDSIRQKILLLSKNGLDELLKNGF